MIFQIQLNIKFYVSMRNKAYFRFYSSIAHSHDDCKE